MSDSSHGAHTLIRRISHCWIVKDTVPKCGPLKPKTYPPHTNLEYSGAAETIQKAINNLSPHAGQAAKPNSRTVS